MEESVSLERLLLTLNSLPEIKDGLISPGELGEAASLSLSMAAGALNASCGVLFRIDRLKSECVLLAGSGVNALRGMSFKVDCREAAQARPEKAVDLNKRHKSPPLPGPVMEALEKLGMSIGACVHFKDEPLGFLGLGRRKTGQPYGEQDLHLLDMITRQIAFSLHNQLLLTRLVHKYNENRDFYESLRGVYYDTIYAFAAAIDAKDAYTKGHSNRVSVYGTMLAKEMGLSREEVEGIRIAGLLHDIGKIAIDKTIINKPSPLTSIECEELKSHPVIGFEILSRIKFPWSGIQMITRSHHEKVDGTGYPDRLKGAEIPAGARVMALVDAFDAMTSDRPYRPRLPFREAMKEVKENTGSQFDKEVVAAFAAMLRKEASGSIKRPVILPLLKEKIEPITVKRVIREFDSSQP